MAREKKKFKKTTVSFCTTKEVIEAIDAIRPAIQVETGKELSRSEVIEIALLRFFKSYNAYIEAKLKTLENNKNKEEK